MNTIELIKKVADSNNITTGRAEMIISIIFERVTDKLKRESFVKIPEFGSFSIESKKSSSGSSEHTSIFAKNYVVFNPDKVFLDIVNS